MGFVALGMGFVEKNWTGNWDLGKIWAGKWDLEPPGPPLQDPLQIVELAQFVFRHLKSVNKLSAALENKFSLQRKSQKS